jgi:RND superfamily putative drug exporter
MEVTMRYARRGGAIIGAIVLVWLLIGVLAAWQRGDFKTGETNCATAGTIAQTVITGPLNYAGANPKVTHPNTPVVILLEGNYDNFQHLGDDAHRYYDSVIRQLQDDPKHVQHIQNEKHVQHTQDVWGDPLTAAAAQSADGKAVYVQLTLAGQQGETLANESVEAVHNVLARTPAPPQVITYVLGPCQSPEGEAAWEQHFARPAPGQ